MPDRLRQISSPTWGDPDEALSGRLADVISGDAILATRIDRDEQTIAVRVGSWVDAARYLRDVEGFDFCSDVVTADWLGYGGEVAGYWASSAFAGRDINRAGSQGKQLVPAPLVAKRFSVSCHLLALATVADGAHRRVRLQTWVDDGESVPTLVAVYPTVDYHEREAFDMMGIVFDGHPNLTRILLPDYWEGHPHRKDYPIGGEPVQFSDAV
jgi:NADH:ubiquinone oxidoreductase subunit C